jgi:hypothetical protein
VTITGDGSHKIEDPQWQGTPGTGGVANTHRLATSIDCVTEGSTVKIRWDATQGVWLTMAM